ncbi:MAG: stalk domain-containing protein [Coprothermobacterota bacterium]|nr:stalk domain-containing protein [Coprothermobacterota bacterium]
MKGKRFFSPILGIVIVALLCPLFVSMPSQLTLAQESAIQLWIGKKDISINGQSQTMDVAPFIQNGRTLVPVRFVSEALGAKVDWIDADKEIVIVLGAKVVGLWIGKDTATVNGVESKLEAPPLIQDSRTFVPLRFVSEALGAKVDWLQEKSQVTIAYSAPVVIRPTTTDTVWRYVVIGDWLPGDFYQFLAADLEKDLGVKIEVIDRTVGGLMESGYLLEKVKTSTSWRADLATAEIITFQAYPLPYLGWYLINGPGTGPDHDKDFSDATFAKYETEMGLIADEILALRKGKPTLLRTQGFFCPLYSQYAQWGILDELIPIWERFDAILAQVAIEHGFKAADIYSVFNGANHREDPRDKGLISGDGEHPSAEGRIMIADIFRRLGYEFIVP